MNKVRWNPIFRGSVIAVMLCHFVFYYVDVNFFCHPHVINGSTIVHSHLHGRHHGDTPDGRHTTSEIILIAQLTNQFLATGDTPATEQTVAEGKPLIYSVAPTQSAVALHLTVTSLRAPPSLFL